MLNIYDRATRTKSAVLENAFDITESETLNSVARLTFSMPDDDAKNQFCQAFHFVRWGDDGDLYRILDRVHTDNGEISVFIYSAEHVISTLIDDVIFGTYQIDNYATREVILRILARQTVPHWQLGDCDFTRYFSYAWSNENLIAALYSVANLLDSPYKWTFDTNSYPWTIHLKLIDETKNPEYYIREGKNLISSELSTKNRDICTRIYPLGYGEGINQLTIRDVNNNVPYIENPEAIAKYGLISRIWEDGRFELPDELLARAQVLLNGLSQPLDVVSVNVANIEQRTGDPIDAARVGKITQFGDFKSFVVHTERKHDAIGEDTVDLANKPEDIAGTIAEQADRARINRVYAQGNTVPFTTSFAENADPTHPLIAEFYVPPEARIVNKVIITWRIEAFRAFSTAAAAGGGGTSSQPGSAITSAAENWLISPGLSFALFSEGPTNVSGSYHQHLSALPTSWLSHVHPITIPAFNINLPVHTHPISYGIYEGARASSITLQVDGKTVVIPTGTTTLDITQHLSVDDAGKIRRGTFHRVTITPNTMTRLAGTIYSQMFIQSEGGVTL